MLFSIITPWLLIIHLLLYIDYLYIIYYLHLQFWHSHWSRFQKQPPKLFLKILQIFQENTCIGSILYKVASLQACNAIKNRLLHREFHVKFEKYLRTPILNDCFCVLINSSFIDFYNSLQYTFCSFTNNFLITQLKQ